MEMNSCVSEVECFVLMMGEQEDQNTFKDNSQSEYFIIDTIVCY